MRNDLYNVRTSFFFKIGSAITYIPRMIRDVIRCYKQHGLSYTLQRSKVRLKSIFKQKKTEVKKDYEFYKNLKSKRYSKELKEWFKKRTGKKLNLKKPKTFNEKIQWIKLYDNTLLKTRLADKYLVRDWVKEKIGEEYLIPLLGVWDKFDYIDFEKLPDKFVLKANHGCGWNVIVKDKSTFDIAEAKKKFDRWMKINYAFFSGLEMHYKDIHPKIIAEQYIENGDGDLYDYKVWCFNGKPKYIMFLAERQTNLKMAFYDTSWNLLPLVNSYPKYDNEVLKPGNLDELLKISEILCKNFSYVRVDFYRLDDGTFKFGEMTFTSFSGVCKWDPPEYDLILGQLIALPVKKKDTFTVV